MSLSTALKKVASNILVKQGQSITIRHETVTAFDPEVGVNITDTSRFTVSGVVDTYSNDEIDGTNIQVGDIKLIIEATSNVPVNGDVVTIEGIDYRIMNVMPVSPAGIHIIYELQLRK